MAGSQCKRHALRPMPKPVLQHWSCVLFSRETPHRTRNGSSRVRRNMRFWIKLYWRRTVEILVPVVSVRVCACVCEGKCETWAGERLTIFSVCDVRERQCVCVDST